MNPRLLAIISASMKSTCMAKICLLWSPTWHLRTNFDFKSYRAVPKENVVVYFSSVVKITFWIKWRKFCKKINEWHHSIPYIHLHWLFPREIIYYHVSTMACIFFVSFSREIFSLWWKFNDFFPYNWNSLFAWG